MKYYLTFITLIVIPCFLSPIESAMTGTDVEEIFADINGGKAQDAIPLADRVIARFQAANKKPGALYMCADSPQENDANLALAKSQKREAISVPMDWCAALYAKAYALIDLDRSDLAEPISRQAVAMAPNNSNFLNDLADHYRGRSQFERALGYYTRAEALASVAPEVTRNTIHGRSLRGMALSKIDLGDMNEAERLLRESLRYSPNNKSALAKLAELAAMAKGRGPTPVKLQTNATARTEPVSPARKSPN